MNTRLVLSIASAVIAVGSVLFAIRAWNSWPSIGRYRIRRNEAATRSTVQKYLEGKISLDSTAIEVGRLMRQRMYLGWADDPNENGMTSVNATLTPPGYSPTDPRIDELSRKSFVEFMGGREAFDRAMEHHRRWLEEQRRDR